MTKQEVLSETHLRYITDKKKGFTRQKKGKGFVYFDENGIKIHDKSTLERIKKLIIPPAWQNVWISPYSNSHLQATGYDNKKRKQYRYHKKWTEVSQENKFSHLSRFAKDLPKIRDQVKKDMSLSGVPKEKIIATLVWLLENTLIRIGNEEYEKENKSYGLTTLKNRHVTIEKNEVEFQFKGKSGVYHQVDIKNKKVIQIIRKCKDLPGQDLFEYKNEQGEIQNISSDDVNEYLKKITNDDISAKDFRTWAGTIIAAQYCDKLGNYKNKTEGKKLITEVVKKVAKHLRNRPATSRKYYIHPIIFESYSKGVTISNTKKTIENIKDLNECERKVLSFLE